MKRFLSVLLSLSLFSAPFVVLPLMTGCAMFSGANQRFSTGAKLALMIGVSEYVRAHPETRPAFVLARDSLLVLSTSDTVDAAMIHAVMNTLPIKEFNSPRGKLFIDAAMVIFTDSVGPLPVDQLKEFQPVAKLFAEGITLGLGTP